MSKNIAVILSGCGVFDGSEIFETVLSLLAIEEVGASYQAFAPDINQHHVINHLTGDEMQESRNVLVEASRIVRGNVKALTELSVDEFDALVVPGGFGAAKNLSSFAFDGEKMQVQADFLKAAKSFHQAQKPIGLMCIAPAMAVAICGEGVELTIGEDQETAEALESMGAKHINCDVNEAYIDEDNLLVTTPAYMLATSVSEAAPGIDLLVKSVIELCDV